MKPKILIKFGGSVMVPEYPSVEYIKSFLNFINKFKKDYRFILITGGGGINSKYNEIAKEITEVSNDDLDWIGIYATRLNARFLISVLGSGCHPDVITDPTGPIDWKENILVAAGWKPGWSTDYDSMILAERFRVQKVIIATNTDYVYDKDPNKNPHATPLKHLSWDDLNKMIGDKWVPRMHTPIDPKAVLYAKEKNIQALLLNGKNIANMERALRGEEFVGTIVS